MRLLIAGKFQSSAIRIAELICWRGIFRLPVSSRERFVVLTVDDAPSSRTNEILDLLARHEVRTTFFIHTDQINTEAREAALSRMQEEHHDIAHHMPADISGAKLSETQFRSGFERAHNTLERYSKSFKRWFRPPQGVYKHGRMVSTLREFGYDRPLPQLSGHRNHFMASFAPWDAVGPTNTPDAVENERIAKRYANQLARCIYPGSIVVFHDGEENNQQQRLAATLHSLDQFLTLAKEREFDVLSLSQAIERC